MGVPAAFRGPGGDLVSAVPRVHLRGALPPPHHFRPTHGPGGELGVPARVSRPLAPRAAARALRALDMVWSVGVARSHGCRALRRLVDMLEQTRRARHADLLSDAPGSASIRPEDGAGGAAFVGLFRCDGVYIATRPIEGFLVNVAGESRSGSE